MAERGYDHANRDAKTRASAELIVPMVCELLRPQSVIDVGCGTGTWLSVFREHGAACVYGLDGAWVDASELEVDANCFRACDLSVPPDLERAFDLAVSLEVAEHLPADRADAFVAYLTRLAPAVLFSAAVPLQGGHLHLNEQWPVYWIERFSQQGYKVFDCIRGKVWGDASVPYWYKQNMLLFVRSSAVDNYPGLRDAGEGFGGKNVVHTELYLSKARKAGHRPRVSGHWRALWQAIGAALRRRWGRVVSVVVRKEAM